MFDRIKNYFLFRNLHRTLQTRPEFRRELWRKLEAEMPEKAALPFFSRFARVAIPLFCFALVFSGTGVYAYTNTDVVPEHPLYPVKRGIEQMEQVLSVTPKAREFARKRRILHRLAEAEIVAERKEVFEGVVREIEKEFAADPDEEKEGVSPAERRKRAAEEKKILRSLETLAEKRADRTAPAVRSILKKDVERLEKRLPAVKKEESRKILEERLDRRKELLRRVEGRGVERESAM